MKFKKAKNFNDLENYHREDGKTGYGYFKGPTDEISDYYYCTKPIIVIKNEKDISFSLMWYIDTQEEELYYRVEDALLNVYPFDLFSQNYTEVYIGEMDYNIKNMDYDSTICVEMPCVDISVADWFESNKGNLGESLYWLRDRLENDYPQTKFEEMYYKSQGKTMEILFDMRHGYTIDKSKELFVIPMPNTDEYLTQLDGTLCFKKWDYPDNCEHKQTFTKEEIEELNPIYQGLEEPLGEDYWRGFIGGLH